MQVSVTHHCRSRYRERIGPANLSVAEIDRRIRRAVSDGRKATKQEARQINKRLGLIAGGKPVKRPDHKSWRSRLVIHNGICFVVARDRKITEGYAAVTCWPWPQQSTEAA